MSRWAAVLAGGSGTRFWPLSTPARPKQFLPLAGDDALLRQAVQRLDGLVPAEQVMVVTGAAYADQTRALLPELPPDNVLGEPQPAGTGPALTWATYVVGERDAGATVLSLHADWFIGDGAAFRRTASQALDAAEHHDVLVTVGIVPTRPEIGYGYIEPGDPLDDQTLRVARFVEKPDRERAAELMARGALWNSGLFAWTAARFFAETAEHASEIAPHVDTLARRGPAAFFAAVTPVVIDISHFERSRRVAVVPGRFDWDDVGTWASLRRVRPTDANGNVRVGRAVTHDAERCVVWADDGPVVLDGVHDLVVVRANGITLVTTLERASQLKTLLEHLPDDLRAPQP